MEKSKPTYDLRAIKATLGSVETLAMTFTAYRDAFRIGFDRPALHRRYQASTGEWSTNR
jgi:motility quorum-sensing regulator/GCU-specific mRNA interferase toxin